MASGKPLSGLPNRTSAGIAVAGPSRRRRTGATGTPPEFSLGWSASRSSRDNVGIQGGARLAARFEFFRGGGPHGWRRGGGRRGPGRDARACAPARSPGGLPPPSPAVPLRLDTISTGDRRSNSARAGRHERCARLPLLGVRGDRPKFGLSPRAATCYRSPPGSVRTIALRPISTAVHAALMRKRLI